MALVVGPTAQAKAPMANWRAYSELEGEEPGDEGVERVEGEDEAHAEDGGHQHPAPVHPVGDCAPEPLEDYESHGVGRREEAPVDDLDAEGPHVEGEDGPLTERDQAVLLSMRRR